MSRPILPESAYEALGLDAETIKILMKPKPPDEPDIAAPNLLQSDEDNAPPMAPNETLITMYAELLLHVRTITLFASLRTHHDRETTATLSSDGACITVSHEGRAASIRMPFEIQGGGEAEMTLPAAPKSKDITLRLQLEELEDSDVLGALQSEERKANVVPWDGASLDKQPGLEVRCKGCHAVVVPPAKIAQWRDLPNENWAEMMDFWHCHKPDEHHLHHGTHQQAANGKGYAAGNRLRATQGLCFVDLTSFLLHDQDCKGAQIVKQTNTQEDFVICKHCNATLGTTDAASNGLRIWKWNIDMQSPSSPSSSSSSSSSPPNHTTQKWITARLLHLIENTGLRKFHIHPPQTPTPTPTPSLLLWIFTPDLLFSSSIPSPTHPRLDPTRSMKIFYKHQTWHPLQPGEPESATVEDVEFPDELFMQLEAALRDSRLVLPASARRFQGWDVGLLQRFDGRDLVVGRGDGDEDAKS